MPLSRLKHIVQTAICELAASRAQTIKQAFSDSLAGENARLHLRRTLRREAEPRMVWTMIDHELTAMKCGCMRGREVLVLP